MTWVTCCCMVVFVVFFGHLVYWCYDSDQRLAENIYQEAKLFQGSDGTNICIVHIFLHNMGEVHTDLGSK